MAATEQSNDSAAKTYHVDIGSERSQVIVRQFVDYVASAQDVLDFTWLQQCLELFRQVRLAVWDMQVANDEDEHLSVGGRRANDFKSDGGETTWAHGGGTDIAPAAVVASSRVQHRA